jgi:hypothetical protein
MKKAYITPALTQAQIEQSLPIAASLEFGEDVNNTGGDVKEQGDWNIWGDED